ncbi:hypothetical protein AMTRI_Chr05g60420 [Amborella trichopoda]
MDFSCSSSKGNLQKYFPHLHLVNAPDQFPDASIIPSPFPLSSISSSILPSNPFKNRCSFQENVLNLTVELALKAQRLVQRAGFSQVRCHSKALAFANIGQLQSDTKHISDLPVSKHEAQGDGEVKVVEKVGGRASSFREMPKFLLAGAVSTIVSRTFVAPLERIKLECIVQGSKYSWIKAVECIWVSEGIGGFWKGNLLNLFRMVPFKSINFICYDIYCDALRQKKDELTNHDRLIGGGISGITATVVCLPLDTIRTRLLAPGGDTLGGVAGCISNMVRNEGFFSLYKGLTPALLSMGPASAVFYAVYDILKSSYLRSKAKAGNSESEACETELGPVRTLIYGAVAGAFAETVTYPLEVVRRQLQLQRAAKVGLFSAFACMIQRDGLNSLFAGLMPSTLQVLPSASLSYLFYELMKSLLKIN